MVQKEHELLWDYEEAPSGTLNGSDLIAYLGRNKIKIRSEGDNITRFAKKNEIRFVVVKRPKGMQFGSNPHYFYPPTKSKMESILKKMNNNVD